MQLQCGHLFQGNPTQCGALLVAHRGQLFGGVGDNGGVGPVHAAGAAHLGGDDTEPNPQMFSGQAGFLMGLPERGLLGGFVAVASTTGKSPGIAQMTPGGAVLQQDGRGPVRRRSAEKQPSGAVPAPMSCARMRHHPAVTVASHRFRINAPRRCPTGDQAPPVTTAS